MASKYQCLCGKIIYTNLFSGNGMYLLIPEEYVDVADEKTDSALIDNVIQTSHTVVTCPQCHRLAIIDKEYHITFYVCEVKQILI